MGPKGVLQLLGHEDRVGRGLCCQPLSSSRQASENSVRLHQLQMENQRPREGRYPASVTQHQNSHSLMPAQGLSQFHFVFD